MDMNLNISTQTVNNFQGNSNNTETASNKNEFEGYFKGLKGNVENSGLVSNIKDEDKQEGIDYNLIQNILSNLQFINQIENTGNINVSEGNSDINLGQLAELIKSQNINGIENNKTDKLLETLVQNKDMKLTDLGEVNSELLKSIKEALDNLKENKISINGGKLETNQVQDNNENTTDVLKSDIDSKYNQLEVSSLSNKASIIQKNESNSSDKDLDTLEDILGGSDNNSFMISNNMNTTSIDGEKLESTNSQPIKEIRQEFIGEDVVKTVKYLKTNGLEEIKIKITPRELGEMTIKLIKDADETKVNIVISKDDVFDLVKRHAGDIVKHLNDLNIKVKEVSVDIKNDNQKFFSDNLNKEFDRKNQQNQNQQQKSKYTNNAIGNIEDINETKIEEDNLNILI